MIEIAIGMLLALSGFAVLNAVSDDLPGGARMWLSIPGGVALYLIGALGLIVVTGTLDPAMALLVTVLLGVSGLVVAATRGDLARTDFRYVGIAVGIAAVTILVTRIVHLTRLTPDSLRYLLAAADLGHPDALSELNRSDLVIRQIGLPALHALSDLVGRQYVASMAPLFGVFGLGYFVWFTRRATEPVGKRRRRWLVITSVLVLGTSNRLVFDAFYINTQIQMAVYLLIAVTCSWLAVKSRAPGWALPAGLALAATLLLRPEAPLIAAIVLVTVAASRAGWATRWLVVLPPVFVMALWYGVVLFQNARGGDALSLTSPVFGSMVALFGAAAVVLVGGMGKTRVVTGYLDLVLLAGLAVLVVAYSVGAPETLIDSLVATFRNVTYNGLWLFTWMVGLALLMVAFFVHRIPDGRLWTVPIAGFALLFWLLPLLREGAYRVGAGDSGNRMLAHFLAIVVAFLVLAAVEPPTVGEQTGGFD